MNWHSMTYQQAAENLGTDINKGLTSSEAKKRLQKYGRNSLTQKKKHGILVKFLMQFKDFMVLILLIASGISFFTAFMSEEIGRAHV